MFHENIALLTGANCHLCIGTCYNLGHRKKGVVDISAIIAQEKKDTLYWNCVTTCVNIHHIWGKLSQWKWRC